MSGNATADMRDDGTPPEVEVNTEARKPQMDPTLGVAVNVTRSGDPKHRLVTIGDSLTHGFQSGAILNSQHSWPRIVAWEMGWDEQFRYPHYWGYGGIPLNVETVVRRLEAQFGDKLDNAWEAISAGYETYELVGRIGSFWKAEWNHDVAQDGILHNLAVWGWDLRDVMARTGATCDAEVAARPNDYFPTANARSGYRVLASAQNNAGWLTPPQAALELSRAGTDTDPNGDGIETLVVLLGANNALGSVINLGAPKWSQAGTGAVPLYQSLTAKKDFTVWQPSHFKAELDAVMAEVEKVKARHVILGTVPHVTIAPIARGVSRDGQKLRLGSRYFEYYTRPWIEPKDFDPRDDKFITAAQARAIDAAIDMYNVAITDWVRAKRKAGHDWYLVDVAGILDRLAARRYLEDPAAQPSWWTEVGGEYPLPPTLSALDPKPNSYFFRSGPTGRTHGGLFSLDGVHPTTIAYGVLAQEFINVMHRAGVVFRYGNGGVRPGPVAVDFQRLIKVDTLISNPPKSLANTLAFLGWLDSKVDGLLGKLGLAVTWP